MKNEERILYTDGESVTVTESVLQVRKKWYSLQGISKHGFAILQPHRLPWMIVLGIGFLLVVVGAIRLLPGSWVPDLYLMDVLVTRHALAIILGIITILTAVGVMITQAERYALSITTADGEHNVVVSKSKEYVACIVHALNDAFFARIQTKKEGGTRQFQVSGR